MKYLIVGAGGVGGTLAWYMKKRGLDAALIARGDHLRAIKENGLCLERDYDGKKESVFINAYDADEYSDVPDVIFVCVKSFSIDSIIPFLERTACKDSVVIPLLNVFTTGTKLREALSGTTVTDGCIYVSSNRDCPGIIRQSVPILRILFGMPDEKAKSPDLKRIETELSAAGFDITCSDDIIKSALEKFSYVSPIGSLGVYLDATAGDFQENCDYRSLFIEMTGEIIKLSQRLGHPLHEDTVKRNLAILDSLPKGETTSFQRDVMANRKTEADGLLHEIVRMSDELGLYLPVYRKVSENLIERGIT